MNAVWKVASELPKLDFAKESAPLRRLRVAAKRALGGMIVVGVYSVGSSLNMAGADLDEKGNLNVLGFGTRDIRPGLRYVLGVVSKEGVKTVNCKELPKE